MLGCLAILGSVGLALYGILQRYPKTSVPVVHTTENLPQYVMPKNEVQELDGKGGGEGGVTCGEGVR